MQRGHHAVVLLIDTSVGSGDFPAGCNDVTDSWQWGRLVSHFGVLEASGDMERWEVYVDDGVAEGSRWHSSSSGLIQTDDAVGDALIAGLREAARVAEDDERIAEWSSFVLDRLGDYKTERRLLMKLADTGRVVHLFQQAIETSLGVLDIRDASTATTWRQRLQEEREQRVALYEALVVDKARMSKEMGDDTQRLEVLTLMKHGVEKFMDVLTSRELDVISAAFDTVTRFSGVAVGEIPPWFATSDNECSGYWNSSVVGGGEEACLREVAIWKELHHPHVRKFYGACHVGKAFVIHENVQFTVTSEATFPRLARPDFLTVQEWELLRGMCATDAALRTGMAHVVQTIRALAKEETKQEALTSQASTLPFDLVQDVKAYICPLGGQTIENLLRDADEMCEEAQELTSVNRPVYSRLEDVFQQLVTVPDPLPADLMEDFSDILWRFYLQLENRSAGDYSMAATLCSSRTVANRNFGLHHEIDRLILKSPVLQDTASVHRWKPTWERAQQEQHVVLQTWLENPSLLLDQLNSEGERSEALVLLQCEARNHRRSFLSGPLAIAAESGEADQLDLLGGEVLPLWFIPPYQVELGKHIADGSFGSVYEGQWLGADVVVKQVLTDQADRANREQFRHEVDLWFTLNHQNLIKLYGACHEGQPFFVCERARLGTVVLCAKGKERRVVWHLLWQAATGLRYLHERRIVHGDLKGNNMLAYDWFDDREEYALIMLAGFGLSAFVDCVESADSEGALGAFRWKAPECLNGSRPTFASDIYSFGMCIIETVTGEFPWGNSIPDEAVKFHVTQEKKLPARPETFNDAEWDLVERMCCFNPDERINVGAATEILSSLLDAN
ncbi:hypothetical protein BBJ28_00019542 [Nothophytophthora sp. Chile5]|nr:hypothetical protein BBJ28_00019542 [Nothophytophthora sp. Chile5]